MASYQVIARRWRPQMFHEILGQEHITKTLMNAIKQKKVAQAYLFSGPRGVGKTSAARILSKALNCEKGPIEIPCGVCTNCVEITNGTSIDVMEIDGASNRGIDQIRDLQQQVRYMPNESKYRIYYIDEVHMLTTEAFNALLKTLEEPPSHVIFIFATTEPNKVKDTIRSRCQHYNFRRLSIETIQQQLHQVCQTEAIKADEDALILIARSADGSMRDAEQALDQVIAFSGTSFSSEDVHTVLGLVKDELCFEFIEYLTQKDLIRLMELTQKIIEEGYSLYQFTQELIYYFRHVILLKQLTGVSKHKLIYLPQDQVMRLQQYAAHFSAYQSNEIMNLFIRLHKELKDTTNEQYMFESVLYRLIDYENFIQYSHILARMEELENRIKHQEPGLEVIQPTRSNLPKETMVKPINKEPSKPIALEEKKVDLGKQDAPAALNPQKEAIPQFSDWINHLKGNNDSFYLGRILELVSEKRMDDKTARLILKFSSDFSLERSKRYKAKLEDSYNTFFGKPIQIDLELDPHAKPSNQEDMNLAQQQILELFDGEIIH